MSKSAVDTAPPEVNRDRAQRPQDIMLNTTARRRLAPWLGGFALALWAHAAGAATVTDIHKRSLAQANQALRATRLELGALAPAEQRHARMLGLEAQSSLVPMTEVQNWTGRHWRYQLAFGGMPVYGHVLMVSEGQDGRVRSMFGNLATGLAADLPSQGTERISAEQALAMAKQADLQDLFRGAALRHEKAEKAIFLDGKRRAHVVFMVSYVASVPGKRRSAEFTTVVDAFTGTVLDRWNASSNADIGTGPGGNLKIGRYEFGEKYGKLDVEQVGSKCIMRNARVQTVDDSDILAGGKPYKFKCPRNAKNQKTNGAYSPLNDAHYFGGVTYDAYQAYLGVPPMARRAELRVHFDTDNAGWDYEGKYAAFGDGDDAHFPWVTMDVVAHEISHGYTARSGLTRNQHQSHGIIEAYADMAGEAVKYFAHGENNFEFGTGVVKGSGAVRYLYDPPLDGKSIDHASKFHAGLDQHYSAGVYNKAFYLLAQSSGWGTVKAFQVFGLAAGLYWGGDMTFDQGACGVEHAARDYRYPPADVTAAFQAVGVSCGMVWEKATAIGLYGGPPPHFTLEGKTVDTGSEPPNGMFGLATRSTNAREHGKRYAEVSFIRQTASKVFGYSGQVCLSLRDQLLDVVGDSGMRGDWSICWFADADTSPIANGPPWFRTDSQVLWGPSGSGPLDAWRITQGDTIGIAVDLDAGRIWYARNGAWIGSPPDGTGAAFDQNAYDVNKHMTGRALTPFLYTDFQNVTARLRGSASELQYPVPSGFVPWSEP